MEKMLLSPPKESFRTKNFRCIISTFIFLFLFNNSSFSQVPEGINYQAIARDTAGVPMDSVNLDVTLNIYDSISPFITVLVYSETHISVTTNRYGLFTLIIGQGDVINSGTFSSINWGGGYKKLEVLIDTTGGTPVSIGTPRLLMSVPYALYAKNAQNSVNSLNSVNSVNSLNSWKLNGNLADDTAFIGTMNNKPFVIKTNANESIRIDINGNVGVGTTVPAAKLDIEGSVKITDGTEGAGKVLTSDATGLASWNTLNAGTVTSFSADSLLPLFTTTVATDSTTPHLEFSFSDAGPYTVFGNNTGTTWPPSYFGLQLASPFFQNQGTNGEVLHGNASGTPSWGQIVATDIANGAVDLTNKVNNILPLANGGSNASLSPVDGGIVYSNATQLQITAAGTSGQLLVSSGNGAPAWTDPTAIVDTNSITNAGIVPAGSGYSNKVWKTDSLGNPGWRADSSSASYAMGTGLSLSGDTLNSVWTQSGNNIFNNNSGNVGIGTSTPSSSLTIQTTTGTELEFAGASNADISANSQLTISSMNFVQLTTAGATRLVVANSGNVGIGATSTPVSKLTIADTSNSISETDFTGALNKAGIQISTTLNNGGRYNPGIFWQASNDNTTKPKAGIWTYMSGAGSRIYMGTSNTYSTGITNKSFVLDQNGNVGIGLSALNLPGAKFDVINADNTGIAGNFENTVAANSSQVLVTKSHSDKEALFASTDGTGNAAVFSVNNSGNAKDALEINTNGGNSSRGLRVTHSGTGNAGKFEITSNASTSNVFEATTSGTGGRAGNFSITNSNNASEVVFATTAGNGRVGVFTNTNSANNSNTVDITTNGANSKGMNVSNTGVATSGNTNYGAYITSTGAGATNVGGYFSATGATTNNYAAIFANGDVKIGPGTNPNNVKLVFYNLSTGNTVSIQSGTTSTSYTLTLPTAVGATGSVLYNTGSGALGWTTLGPTGSGTTNYISKWTGATALGNSLLFDNGTGVGVGTASPVGMFHVLNTGSSNRTGYFETNNASNSAATLVAQTNGSGSAIYVNSTGTWRAADISITNPSNLYDALYVKTNGTGKAGYFETDNTGSTSDAVTITTKGNNSKGLNISHTGATASSTDYGLYVTNTGGGTDNIAAYFSATNATNNYAAIFANGNVGIGTTAPTNKLDVKGGIAIGNSYVGITAPAQGAIIEGNVGIGTTAPANKLDVKGGIAIGNSYVGTSAPSQGAIIEGNVGIGTSAPTSPLTINTVAGNDLEFVASGGSNANIYSATQLDIGSLSSVNLLTNGATRLTVDNTGNVGIGTAGTINSTLQVNGSTASAVSIFTTSGNLAASIALDNTYSIIIIKGTGTGATTLTLPTASSAPGRIYFIKNVQATSAVSFVRSGSDLIDGIYTSLSVNYLEGYIIVSDGSSGWHIIAKK